MGPGLKNRHQIITSFWFRSTGSIYGFVGRTSEKAINNLHLCSFSQGKAWWTSGLEITHFSDKPSFPWKRSWISWWLAQAVMDQSVPMTTVQQTMTAMTTDVIGEGLKGNRCFLWAPPRSCHAGSPPWVFAPWLAQWLVVSNGVLGSTVSVISGYTGWWFQTCFIFHNIWDNPSHWWTHIVQDG